VPVIHTAGLPRRAWLALMRMPVSSRCITVAAGLSGTGGAIWGLVRGVDYLPTLPAAVVEGAILVGVPGTLVGVVVGGVVALTTRLRR
jgi:hypothetical protein